MIGLTKRSVRVHAPAPRSTLTEPPTRKTARIFVLHAAQIIIYSSRPASGRRAATTPGPTPRAQPPILYRTPANLLRLIARRRWGLLPRAAAADPERSTCSTCRRRLMPPTNHLLANTRDTHLKLPGNGRLTLCKIPLLTFIGVYSSPESCRPSTMPVATLYPYTPPTPTRRKCRDESHRRRRCVLGITGCSVTWYSVPKNCHVLCT